MTPGSTKVPDRRSWWTSLFVLCAILGALMGLSFKTQNAVRSRYLPSTSYNGLAEGYTVLKQEIDGQQRTIAALELNTQRLQNSTTSDTKQAQVLADDLKQANFLAGLTSVQGQGLVVTLNDSKKRFPGAPTQIQNLVIIHDNDINSIVNELKDAGAEALSVNNQRLVATSPIRCAGNIVLVNNVPQAPPFVIRAIGDGPTMESGLNLPGGYAEQLRAEDPAMIKMQQAPHLVVPAFAGSTQPKYAKPVAVPGTQQVAKG
jgi:uncharacterized protein YlxW (UPF0749 family)